MNSVILIGRLVRDPELRVVPATGTSVVKFTLAIDKDLTREKKQEFANSGKPTADFIRVVVWGKQADACHNYLSKGKLVAVQGSIQTSSFKAQNGEVRYNTEVIANKVEFLEWGDKKPMRQSSNDDFDSFAGEFEDGFAENDTMEGEDVHF